MKKKKNYLNEEEGDDDNDDIAEDRNIFSQGRFIVIDTDITSFKIKNLRLIALHAVEVKDGQLKGIFFIFSLIKETIIMIPSIIQQNIIIVLLKKKNYKNF